MKKLLLGLGAVATIATPVIAVVSCGNASQNTRTSVADAFGQTEAAAKAAQLAAKEAALKAEQAAILSQEAQLEWSNTRAEAAAKAADAYLAKLNAEAEASKLEAIAKSHNDQSYLVQVALIKAEAERKAKEAADAAKLEAAKAEEAARALAAQQAAAKAAEDAAKLAAEKAATDAANGPKVEQKGDGQNKFVAAMDRVEKFISSHPEAMLINIKLKLLSDLGVTEWHFQRNEQGMWVNSQRIMVRDLYNQLKMNVTNVSDQELEAFLKRFAEQKDQITSTAEEIDEAWGSAGLLDSMGGTSAQEKLESKDVEWLKTLTDEEIAKLILEAGIYTNPDGSAADPDAVKTAKDNIGIILGYKPATLDSIDAGAKVPGTTFRQEIVEMVTKDTKGQLDTVKLLAQRGVDLANSNPFVDSDCVEIYDKGYNGIDGYKTMTPLMKFNINE